MSFNHTFRYIDDVLSINNHNFHNYVHLIYPDELDIKDTTESDKSLTKYLQNIALITDADEDTGNNDVVSLMSVHAAKGLEYRSVFVVGLEENLFPSYMSLYDSNFDFTIVNFPLLCSNIPLSSAYGV